MTGAEGISEFAAGRDLAPGRAEELRELTPALLRGRGGSVPAIFTGPIAPGLEGTLCHHVYADGGRSRKSTIVLTRLAESAAFVPAMVCRDRDSQSDGRPAQLPAERWKRTELESAGFNRRYLLLTLAGQDPGLVRELFSPSLIAWLESTPPPGFSVELNEGNLTVAVPGHLTDLGELARLCNLAAEMGRRIGTEIAEEEGEHADLFDESPELAAVEKAMAKVSWEHPPASVGEAVEAYRRRAAWTVPVLLTTLMWAAIGLGVGGAIGLVIGAVTGQGIAGPLAAIVVGLPLGAAGWWLGRLMGSARHRWGTASVSRVAHEAFVRGYAESRGLKLENRWRFHSEYRHITWPGFADHVLAGELPQTDGLTGHFVMLGDAAEMRSTGTEIAYFSERPLASSALLVRAERELTGADGDVETPEDYELEIRGRDVMVWRPIQGNLLRTAAGSDRFCAKAGALMREVLDPTARG